METKYKNNELFISIFLINLLKFNILKNLYMYYFNKIYIFNILIKTHNKNKLNIII